MAPAVNYRETSFPIHPGKDNLCSCAVIEGRKEPNQLAVLEFGPPEGFEANKVRCILTCEEDEYDEHAPFCTTQCLESAAYSRIGTSMAKFLLAPSNFEALHRNLSEDIYVEVCKDSSAQPPGSTPLKMTRKLEPAENRSPFTGHNSQTVLCSTHPNAGTGMSFQEFWDACRNDPVACQLPRLLPVIIIQEMYRMVVQEKVQRLLDNTATQEAIEQEMHQKALSGRSFRRVILCKPKCKAAGDRILSIFAEKSEDGGTGRIIIMYANNSFTRAQVTLKVPAERGQKGLVQAEQFTTSSFSMDNYPLCPELLPGKYMEEVVLPESCDEGRRGASWDWKLVRREMVLAVFMGFHSRLGANCPYRDMDHNVMRSAVLCTTGVTTAEIAALLRGMCTRSAA